MKIRIKHHRALWCKEPEWVETEVEVRAVTAGDVVTGNPWGDNPYGTNPAWFDVKTGLHHTWGQGIDELDNFAIIHEADRDILRLLNAVLGEPEQGTENK